MIEKSYRWQRTVVAAAATALLGLSATQAWALSLGRISVQSSLGEPLRAEIDIPSITPEEAATLKASVASPAAFTAAGLEYSAAMTGLQATLARRADGRAYLRLTTDKAVNDPYIDMILEASWATGRIVRDYTMLFDPPSFKQAAAPTPTLPQTSAPAVTAVPKAAPAATPEPAARASKPVAPVVRQQAAPAAPEGSAGQRVVVKSGDSASKIASRNKASDVSLDQMLVALLRSNPDAFNSGNLNRLRAGAVLDLPSSDQAKSISPTEASQTVVAQSKDFEAFRRNLAGSAPKASVEAPDRKATGTVEAKVDDKKQAKEAADKLTLSKGALKAQADAEAKLAKERADADAKARAAELAKNIEDLKKLSAESGSAAAVTQAASAPSAPAIEVAMPKGDAVAAPAAPASDASAPVAKPKAVAPVVSTMAPEEEPSMVDALLEDPMVPLAGGGLVALLGGLLLYRRSKAKKQAASMDSSFMESSLQPESYFGASGGQQIDTAQGNTGGSSMGYTNSQMGSPDDVDPVAEADVYLAYGRDLQAEEILKAALPANPERLAIHSKLLEIYAKRRDAASFLASANTAFKLTGPDSAEWARICALGLTIDPENPLYQPGGASSSGFVAVAATGAATADAATQAIDAMPAPAADVDLDLDFSADDPVPASPVAAPEPAPAPAAADDMNGLDFDISGPAALDATPPAAPEPVGEIPNISLSLDDMSLDMPQSPQPEPAPEPVAEAPSLELPDFDLPAPAPEPAPEPAKASDGMLEFDLGSLSLDLDPGTPADAGPGDSSLETKLALAEEFVSIGDNDGARALIEEVVAEATGDLRERAQRALANLS